MTATTPSSDPKTGPTTAPPPAARFVTVLPKGRQAGKLPAAGIKFTVAAWERIETAVEHDSNFLVDAPKHWKVRFGSDDMWTEFRIDGKAWTQWEPRQPENLDALVLLLHYHEAITVELPPLESTRQITQEDRDSLRKGPGQPPDMRSRRQRLEHLAELEFMSEDKA
ncbi:MAG: hypothetical protein WC876_03080 [Candidatus Thermoplasmatota archaeon]